MKKLLCLIALPLALGAQVVTIPNTTFPAVRAFMNSNFSYLAANKEPSITAGTTAQYWRGDKSWQSLATGARGLFSAVSPLLYNSSTGAFSCPSCGSGSGPAGASWATGTFTSTASFTITHNLNTASPLVTLYDSSGFLLGSAGSAANATAIQATSVNAVAVTLSASATGTWSVVGPPASGASLSWTTSLTNAEWTGSLTNSQWTSTITN